MHSFAVSGTPVPQGSVRSFGNGKIVSKSPKLIAWREAIAEVVTKEVGDFHTDDAVKIVAVFVMPQAKSNKLERPKGRPDLDKLTRALGDALSVDCGYLNDDSQIVEWHVTKIWGEPGVFFTIESVENTLLNVP